MSREARKVLRHLLDSAQTNGLLTGAVGACGIGDVRTFSYFVGSDGSGAFVNESSLFDLASLTKVAATVPTLLRLVGQNLVRPADRLGDFVVGLPRETSAISLDQLMSHTSGLPAIPVVTNVETAEELLRRIKTKDAGTIVRYSDVGFIALGVVIEKISRAPLEQAFVQHVVGPLGLRQVCFGTSRSSKTVPTGLRSGPDSQPTHDPAARKLGGLAGHAGMFASLSDVEKIMFGWLKGGWITEMLRERAFTRRSGGAVGGVRGWGWSLRGDDYHCVRDDWPPTTVTHTGYTGTSVAADAASGIWAVLLSNGLPNGSDASGIVRLRRDFNTEALRHVLAVGATKGKREG